MKPCEEIDLNAFHDGECEDPESIKLHLRECPACQSQLQELQALDALIRGEGPARLSWPAPARPRPRSWRWLKAALVLLSLGGIGLMGLRLALPQLQPKEISPGPVQVVHGDRLYTLEVRGQGTQLVQFEVEDEFGNGRVQFAKPSQQSKEID